MWLSRTILFGPLALVLAGCAIGVPQAIRKAPAAVPTVAEVQQAAPGYLGQRVRWGGTILAVRNQAEATEVELLARPLRDGGEPHGEAPGAGRFLAEVPGFLDPAEYPEGRLLTLSGRLVRVETRPVGEYPYRFPVMSAEVWHLWPEAPEPVYVAPPALYYPWYDPWYFPGFRPWYHPWRP